MKQARSMKGTTKQKRCRSGILEKESVKQLE